MKVKQVPSLLLLLLFLVLNLSAYSQNQKKPENIHDLYTTIARLDSSLFATAYTCNTEKNSVYFTDDLEFYHDKAGLVASSKKQFLESNEKKFCGDQHGFILRRELVPGTMKVYTLQNYGALQTGEHRFFQTTKEKKETMVEVGKFTHLWQYNNGAWRISRIISYDHQEVKAK